MPENCGMAGPNCIAKGLAGSEAVRLWPWKPAIDGLGSMIWSWSLGFGKRREPLSRIMYGERGGVVAAVITVSGDQL